MAALRIRPDETAIYNVPERLLPNDDPIEQSGPCEMRLVNIRLRSDAGFVSGLGFRPRGAGVFHLGVDAAAHALEAGTHVLEGPDDLPADGGILDGGVDGRAEELGLEEDLTEDVGDGLVLGVGFGRGGELDRSVGGIQCGLVLGEFGDGRGDLAGQGDGALAPEEFVDGVVAFMGGDEIAHAVEARKRAGIDEDDGRSVGGGHLRALASSRRRSAHRQGLDPGHAEELLQRHEVGVVEGGAVNRALRIILIPQRRVDVGDHLFVGSRPGFAAGLHHEGIVEDIDTGHRHAVLLRGVSGGVHPHG